MTAPVEPDPWEAYQAAYPGVLTHVSDPDNAMFAPVPDVSEENPYDDGPLDSDGLTDDEYAMIFERPAEDVPLALLASAWASEVEVATPVAEAAREELQSRMPRQLQDYWLHGEGAAKVRWGTPGSFTRCVKELREHFPQGVNGLCANLYHEATGHWPGEDRNK